MAELVVSSAHSAVESLLGRLTRILEDEARLLGGIRGDVQFIKDEMESMNGFLLHVVELDRPDHQLQAWTKQVKDLARDSENCVDVYMQTQCLGADHGPLGRLLRLLLTLPARRRIATRIRELKSRACDVGQRRSRYGVVVPRAGAAGSTTSGAHRRQENPRRRLLVKQLSEAGGGEHDGSDKKDRRRRALLEEETPANLFAGDPDMLIQWLQATDDDDAAAEQGRPKVIAIIRPDGDELVGATDPAAARRVFDHPSIQQLFQFRVWISSPTHPGWAYEDILAQIPRVWQCINSQVKAFLQEHLYQTLGRMGFHQTTMGRRMANRKRVMMMMMMKKKKKKKKKILSLIKNKKKKDSIQGTSSDTNKEEVPEETTSKTNNNEVPEEATTSGKTTIIEPSKKKKKKKKKKKEEEEEEFLGGTPSKYRKEVPEGTRTKSEEKKNILQATTSEKMAVVESCKEKRFPKEEETSKKMIETCQGTASENKGFLEGSTTSEKKMKFPEEIMPEETTESRKEMLTKKNQEAQEEKETPKEKEFHGGIVQPETMESDNTMGVQEGMTFEEMMKFFLKDINFMIVLDDVPDESLWLRIKSAFPGDTAHSAILLTTKSPAVAYSCLPHRVFPPLEPLVDFFHDKAISLIENNPNDGDDMKQVLRSIVSKCASNSSDLCLRAFLHVLYANPNRNKEELQSLCDNLDDSHGLMLEENTQQILMFWYNDLPIHYKSCLMYLSVFLQDDGNGSNLTGEMRRTSLVRRWAAESMITGRDGLTALDEAERCFDVLLAKRFVLEREIGASGKVKSCVVNGLISEFITKVARDESFVDADLQPDFAHRVSVRNRSQMQQILAELQSSPRPNYSCWNICKNSIPKEEDDLTMFLESLPAFSRLGLLKVLDLEGCDGLKEHHLENICKLYQLRYLNLRRSKITKLPKKIQNLQQLETLDIRETAVSSFATKALVLPMLKHLLSGFTKQQNDQQTEEFSTVRMPHGIAGMTNLQILCHVDVSDKEDQLMDIGKLPQLRKLGVVFSGNRNSFKHLLQAIEKLNRSLISLSIRVQVSDGHETPDMNMAEPTAFSFPKFLESLNFSGVKSGLPRWLKELSRLAKLTLCETHLEEQDMAVVGNLKALQYLRLRHRSYVQSKLTLGEKQFQHLKILLIHGQDVTDISFNKTPKLEKMVWGFREMKSISGIDRLPSLRALELHGDCNPDKVEKALRDHPNHPDFKHNGNRQGQEEAGRLAAAVDSTSNSAPTPAAGAGTSASASASASAP